MITPTKLRPGDNVALLSASSPLEPENRPLIHRAIALLESWGLRVSDLSQPDIVHPYLAGTDAHRASALREAWTDPDIKALLFTRGGYGSARLLHHLDHDALRPHRKLIVGYSDVTTLLLYFQKLTNSVVYHGPNLATRRMFDSPAAAISQASLHAALFDGAAARHPLTPLRSSSVEGEFIGGNLTLLSSSLGTKHEPSTDGKILFVENVKKSPLQIDRLLTHLRNAGKLEALKGIVFADMSGCTGGPGALWETVSDLFKDDAFPIFYGVPSGHGAHCLTLPLGAIAHLDTHRSELRFDDERSPASA